MQFLPTGWGGLEATHVMFNASPDFRAFKGLELEIAALQHSFPKEKVCW
jgi:hypothetical protein